MIEREGHEFARREKTRVVGRRFGQRGHLPEGKRQLKLLGIWIYFDRVSMLGDRALLSAVRGEARAVWQRSHSPGFLAVP